MNPPPVRRSPDFAVPLPARAGLRLHLALAAVALLTSVFLPRPGEGVLLIPLGREQSGAFGAGWTLSDRGRIGGTWLVHPSGPVPVWALLRHGIVPLAVPESLCGARP